MEFDVADIQRPQREQADHSEEEEQDPFAGHEAAYEDDVEMEEEPVETINDDALLEDDLRDEDISDNNPIHDYQDSETEDGEETYTDTEDESCTEQEIANYKRLEAIENAQKMGLKFSPDARLTGNSVLACYVRHGILEMRGPFDYREWKPQIQSSTPYIPQFEDIPVILSRAVVSSTGSLIGPISPLVSQRTSQHGGDHASLKQHQMLIAVRVSRDGSWVTLPGFRRLVRTFLRYRPKDFERPGHIRISNQIRHPGFQALLIKLYSDVYWLPLAQAALVTKQLLVERPGRPFEISHETLRNSQQLSRHASEAEKSVDIPRVEISAEAEDNEVQQHPLSVGYVSGSHLRSLANSCKLMVRAVLADFPQAIPQKHSKKEPEEVDDFLGPPRSAALELPPWKPITMSMTNNDSTRLNIRQVNKFLIFANEQAMLAINVYEPALLKHDLHFKGLTMAHIFRCILRIKVIAELAECLDGEGLRINRDGPMWSLLLPFYVNGGTPNAAEMSVIAGQAPQFGRPRPNWDQPTHGLHNILHATRLTSFPMDLVHRDQFWEWVENRPR